MEQQCKPYQYVQAFLRREGGAVTVDWIVLTALLATMGLGMAFVVNSNVPGLADSISTYMDDYDIGG